MLYMVIFLISDRIGSVNSSIYEKKERKEKAFNIIRYLTPFQFLDYFIIIDYLIKKILNEFIPRIKIGGGAK